MHLTVVFGVGSIRNQEGQWKKLTSLTCSKEQGVVFFEQVALLIQEPLRAEHFWFNPEVGVIVEAPQVHDHGCVLHQNTHC